jgi:hypothetical protein
VKNSIGKKRKRVDEEEEEVKMAEVLLYYT